MFSRAVAKEPISIVLYISEPAARYKSCSFILFGILVDLHGPRFSSDKHRFRVFSQCIQFGSLLKAVATNTTKRFRKTLPRKRFREEVVNLFQLAQIVEHRTYCHSLRQVEGSSSRPDQLSASQNDWGECAGLCFDICKGLHVPVFSDKDNKWQAQSPASSLTKRRDHCSQCFGVDSSPKLRTSAKPSFKIVNCSMQSDQVSLQSVVKRHELMDMALQK